MKKVEKKDWSIELDEKLNNSMFEINGMLLKRFNEWRKEKRITLLGLHRQSGVSVTRIHNWIRYQSMLSSYYAIYRIATVLGFKITVK